MYFMGVQFTAHHFFMFLFFFVQLFCWMFIPLELFEKKRQDG